MGEEGKNLSEYLVAARRRWPTMVATSVSILGLAVLVAFLWPPVYTSTATILIEEQDIPPDLVRSTVTTYAWQRIQTISQRVMTRATLLQIVDKYDLYAEERKSKTSEEIVEQMREDISLEPISADVIDPRSGRPMQATIAFTLGYESNQPAVAQKVANELTSLYLNENLKSRTERAEETYNFLTEETNRLNTEIAELETRMAQFKERNVDNLPELAGFNHQLVERTQGELRETRTQIRALEERKFYLEGQLGQLSPTSPMYAPTGERIPDPGTRLKMLKTELAAVTARYSPRHPDVVRLQEEIDGLEKEVGSVSPDQEQARQLAKLRSELASAREKYGEHHPDVARLRSEIESLEKSLSKTAPPESFVLAEKPDNPAYINIKSQLEGVASQLRSLEKKREELSARIADYERRIAMSPSVEREYLELKRNHENAQLKYREIKAKQMEAQVGQQLEKERKGERFTLIDPPQLPQKPVRPNRPAIALLGLILSLVGGIGYAFAAESLDTSVKSPRGLLAILKEAPLSIVPYVRNSEDISRDRRVRRIAIQSALAAFVAVAVIVQFFWVPWDILWFKGLRILSGG
ncbi:lipopolysaccharide biosynthesis protein [Sulfurifustis variabilis]|uniref:Lipopolysaccharide biosynthesis protein n=1 Tax=Sulfurifustis variabilis TaxID=1675686 RepID=A0A1B4V639_9GAMM|nr:GNVR domain-containing protein [Sulfurifustis variabilis]BAU48042.1 lipopolysaccharide biosynthesis protein [Sulfurifustis variabilis]